MQTVDRIGLALTALGQPISAQRDQNQKQRFDNDCTGYRVVVPMGAGTGERGDYVVLMTLIASIKPPQTPNAPPQWNGGTGR
jgi:hypothetical protein